MNRRSFRSLVGRSANVIQLCFAHNWIALSSSARLSSLSNITKRKELDSYRASACSTINSTHHVIIATDIHY